MVDINEFALLQAEAAAARLWAFGSAPFPLVKGRAICVLYLKTRTDQREDALIDVFALATRFFHQVLPALRQPVQ